MNPEPGDDRLPKGRLVLMAMTRNPKAMNAAPAT